MAKRPVNKKPQAFTKVQQDFMRQWPLSRLIERLGILELEVALQLTKPSSRAIKQDLKRELGRLRSERLFYYQQLVQLIDIPHSVTPTKRKAYEKILGAILPLISSAGGKRQRTAKR
jgi:hypothetical protein